MLEVKKVTIGCLDKRGRMSLGKYVNHDMFMIDVADDGIITLTPMVALPKKVSDRLDRDAGIEADAPRVTRLQQRFEEIVA